MKQKLYDFFWVVVWWFSLMIAVVVIGVLFIPILFIGIFILTKEKYTEISLDIIGFFKV